MDRAYSILHVKSVDAEKRTFSGIATTPTPDRVDDIVEPKGAKFKNPIPLHLYHDSRLPVGTVKFGKPTDEGIPFDASIPEVTEAGTLRERVNEAWHSVKYGIIRGVSIGFNVLQDGIEMLRSGGVRFTNYEVLELSLVSIPANAEATIQSIKSYDAPHLAALGKGDEAPRSRSGASDISTSPMRRKDAGPMKKPLAEQIKDFEATRASKAARMEEIQAKAGDEGRGKDEAEREEFDTLKAEIKSIDAELVDLHDMEKLAATKAAPVAGRSAEDGAAARGGHVVSVSEPKMEPGIAYARSVMCELQARMDHRDVLSIAKARYPSHQSLHKFIEHKATVPAATSGDATYAGPLVYAQNVVGEFIEFLRPATIVGKFGQDGLPSLTKVPFNVRVNAQTSDGNAEWVGEGAGKPLTSVGFNAVTLAHDKVATIAVLTKEVVRLSTPSAEELVRNSLRNAIVKRIDISFIDPANAGTANVKPASITNGLTPLSSAGTSSDNVITDIGRLLQAYVQNELDPSGLVLIMPATLAMVVGLMRNALGQKVFPDINMRGGVLEGIPVITTQHAANQSGAGNLVIAVHAPSILLADDGVVNVDASDQVSLQMSDAPTINSTTGTGASLVSMWQTNSLAVRAEREITWRKARTQAVVYMDDVNWASVGSPS